MIQNLKKTNKHKAHVLLEHYIIHSHNQPDFPVSALTLLKPNDLKKRRTAQLTSRCCILYIYSTNIHTEYFKHAA